VRADARILERALLIIGSSNPEIVLFLPHGEHAKSVSPTK